MVFSSAPFTFFMPAMTPIFSQLPPATGPVRILSDLHLGHDLSKVRDVESLRPLIVGAARVIFNGDTFQERGTAFRDRSFIQLEKLQNLCREEGADAIFLRGNHDPTAWDLELVDLLEGQVTVTHGDVWLRLISPWSKGMREMRPALEAIHAEYPDAARMDLATQFEILRRCRLALPPSGTRHQGHSLQNRVALFLREMWPPRRPWEVLKVYTRLPGMASNFIKSFRPASRVLLFGHTHSAGVWRRGGRLLVNTGAFGIFAKPLMVEIHHRTLNVLRLEERGGFWQTQSVAATQKLD